MSTVTELCSHNGVTIYAHDDIGILINPSQTARLTKSELISLLRWCVEHDTEAAALQVVERCFYISRSMLPQLADWIINAVAEGELAKEEIKSWAQKERLRRTLAPDDILGLQFESALSPKTKPKRKYSGYIYLLQAGPYYKIGVSSNVSRRIKQLATLPPFNLDLICTIRSLDTYSLEARLHERFAEKRVNGEWFELDEDDVAYIKSLGENDAQ